MVYIPFETCMALAMVNVFVKMLLTLHVPFKTLVMVYVPYETHLALTMVNFFIKCTLPIITSLMFLPKHKPKWSKHDKGTTKGMECHILS
jgi:hypothetical protein